MYRVCCTSYQSCAKFGSRRTNVFANFAHSSVQGIFSTCKLFFIHTVVNFLLLLINVLENYNICTGKVANSKEILNLHSWFVATYYLPIDDIFVGDSKNGS